MPNENDTPDAEDIRFTLLENALDSIAFGIGRIAAAATKRDLKQGVLNVDAGIELLLKERLRQEDWTLLFPKPAQADENLYKSGDFRSVEIHTCLERLDEHTIADVPKNTADMIRAYRRRRNKMQHFQFRDSKEGIEGATAQLLSAVLDFIHVEFEDTELTQEENDLLAEVRDGLNGFKRYIEERLAHVKPRLDEWRAEGFTILECPVCLQECLMADAGVNCAFCGFTSDSEDAARLYIENVMGETKFSAWRDGGTFPLYHCPECCSHALVNHDEAKFVCFGCGIEYDNGELEICDDCGDPCDSEERFGGRCNECWNLFIARDNT